MNDVSMDERLRLRLYDYFVLDHKPSILQKTEYKRLREMYYDNDEFRNKLDEALKVNGYVENEKRKPAKNESVINNPLMTGRIILTAKGLNAIRWGYRRTVTHKERYVRWTFVIACVTVVLVILTFLKSFGVFAWL